MDIQKLVASAHKLKEKNEEIDAVLIVGVNEDSTVLASTELSRDVRENILFALINDFTVEFGPMASLERIILMYISSVEKLIDEAAEASIHGN